VHSYKHHYVPEQVVKSSRSFSTEAWKFESILDKADWDRGRDHTLLHPMSAPTSHNEMPYLIIIAF
jgi:hypothetical protein